MSNGPPGAISGVLHAYVAFDLGEEIDLSGVKRRLPAEDHRLPRQSRTPSSVAYDPPPLRLSLGNVSLDLRDLKQQEGTADVTVFDFAAVSVAVHVPFVMSADDLGRLADWLADPAPIVARAEAMLRPLFEQMRPAIRSPAWSDLNEEYFVFQLLPQESLPEGEQLLSGHAHWLAGLVRLDSASFSTGEVREALRLHLSYGPHDLVVPDWAAAVIVDRDCDEILETIAFANLQLLEFRHIDRRLDDRLEQAYDMIHQLSRSWLPYWRSYTRPLRALGLLKVEINEMMERTSNVLKLMGDQYLARLYQMVGGRFHLVEWGRSVRHSLDVLEGIYQVVADQAATFRAEVLEWIIILLILIEVIMSLAEKAGL